jgi:hypothetical protein
MVQTEDGNGMASANTEQLRWYGMQGPRAEAQGGQVDSQPTQAVAPQAEARPETDTGFSVNLTAKEAQSALKKAALKKAKKRRGWKVPLRPDEFVELAEVHPAVGAVQVVVKA